MAVSTDPEHAATGRVVVAAGDSEGSTLVLLNADDGTVVSVLEQDVAAPDHVLVSADGRWISALHGDETRVYELH